MMEQGNTAGRSRTPFSQCATTSFNHLLWESTCEQQLLMNMSQVHVKTQQLYALEQVHGAGFNVRQEVQCLTGSAESVAILTPLEVSSLYLSARRPISVVQTGCKQHHTLRQPSTMAWRMCASKTYRAAGKKHEGCSDPL